MITSTVLALAVVGELAVDIVGDTTCTTTTAVWTATEPRIPAEVPLHVALSITSSASTILVALDMDIDETSATSRRLELVTIDCPLVPRLIASIAERYVTALPNRDWAAFRRARRLRVIRPRERAPPFVPQPPVELWLGPDVGVAPAPSASRVHVDARLVLGRLDRFSGSLVLGASWVPSAAIGTGRIDVFSVYGGAGPAWTFAVGTAQLVPRLLVTGGAYIGRARGFERASSEVIALLDAVADVALRLDGFHVAVGAVVTMLRPQFVRAATRDTYDEPVVRLTVSAGWGAPIASW